MPRLAEAAATFFRELQSANFVAIHFLTITLPPALDALLARKMATGRYADTGEVVREALRQMESRESALEMLRREATSGFDQLDRGDAVEMDRDSFMNHFRDRRQAA